MNYNNDEVLFNQIQIKLGVVDSLDNKRIIGRVIHVLRDQLSEEESEEIIQKLPVDLTMIYLTAWKVTPHRSSTYHLDEFVTRLLETDSIMPKRVFRTEIEALRASIIVLTELDKRYNLLDYLPGSIKNELNNAMLNEAA